MIRNWCLSISLLLLGGHVCGQKFSLEGTVVDEVSGEPIPYANVFINQTTIGTATNNQGQFKLDLLPGNVELVISHVGYLYLTQSLFFDKPTDLGDIRLSSDSGQLNEVVVQSKQDRNWEKNLQDFEKVALGEYALARQAKIVNPWVLEFEEQDKQTLVTAALPLRVSNDFLGYDLLLFLKRSALNAMGYEVFASVYFSEKAPASPQDSYRWATNRLTAYQRSSRFLFKSVIDKRISGNGFHLYTDNPGGNQANTYLEGTDNFRRAYGSSIIDYDTVGMSSKNENKTWTIAVNGRLEVHYRKARSVIRAYEDIGFPVSWIAVKGALLTVDDKGVPLNPQNLITSGDMNSNWLVRLLPNDYGPPEIQSGKPDNSYNEALRERFYIHCDKPYYMLGEKIWYKVYVDHTKQSLKDSLSRVLYVELVSPQSHVVASQTLPVNNGFAYGELKLADSLSVGKYFLRAYTNLSLNFEDKGIYYKPIPIININTKLTTGQSSDQRPGFGIFIKPEKNSYAPRERIVLNIETYNQSQKPIAAHLSIAVTDTRQVTALNGKDIVDFYQEVNHYFEAPDMLKYPVESGIALKGIAQDKKSRGEQATVTLVDWQTKEMYQFVTEEDGQFSISGLDFFGSRAFAFEARTKRNKPGTVILFPREVPPVKLPTDDLDFKMEETDMPQRMVNPYQLSEGTRMLDEVIIEDGRINMPQFKSTYGRPDRVLEEKDINKSYPSIIYSLYKIIPDGKVLRTGNLSVLNPAEMLVTINDVPVFGDPTTTLSMIDPNTVERVELTTRLNVLYGSQAVAGVIAVYLKQGADTPYEPRQTTEVSIIKGFTRPGFFTSPDYSNTEDANPDFRSTLYWNPEMITDPTTGKASVTFYAADLETTYRVVVEGVNSKNAPVRGEYIINIDRP